ncbi:hypothetical protein [Amaricoccus sp. W119]|uniref:hypothetical protein n=1 Tax=Amaricoccus sp. W119 TaxID=3391833 RepID=UPI0039A449EF
MTFAEPVDLIRLLLRQSDRHPIRAVGAEDLQPYDPHPVRRLKTLGILIERVDQRDEGDAVLAIDDGALIEIDTETGECSRLPDAHDIQLCDIDLEAVCRQLRAQSDLTGPGPARLSPRLWRLGRHQRKDRAVEVCLVRQMRGGTAQEIVDHARGAIDTETPVALIALSPVEVPTPLARQLNGPRMTVTCIEDHLGADSARPFALDLTRLRLPVCSAETAARLSIDRVGRRVTFDAVELAVEPRDFDMFVLLAEEAAGGGGWVQRDTISTTLQSATGRPGNPEQADRSINRLRDLFRKNGRLAAVPQNGFIETKPKVGYRLTLATSEIGFMA